MKKLYLFILWHMHQPLYKDPYTKRYELPWTLLHLLKDYKRIPSYSLDYRVKVNFNLTPVLIDQIEDYSKGVSCRLLNMLEEDTDREFLQRLIKALPQRMKQSLKAQDVLSYLNLWAQVELKQDEVHTYVKVHAKSTLELYRDLYHSSRIGLLTSPYYHPILPLLISKISLLEDALTHVRMAKERFREIFGKEPMAMWPSEGAINEQTFDVFKNLGIRLIFSDERVFFNSSGATIREELYKLYNYRGVFILFRDRVLSDRVGFLYKDWKHEDAVEDFLSYLKNVFDRCSFSPIVSVILDGENPWEHYPNQGEDFLRGLYGRLQEQDWIETVSVEDLLKGDFEAHTLSSVEAGTWTDGFHMWEGHPQKEHMWEELKKARSLYGQKRCFLVAEGSDWFWWGGVEGNLFSQEFNNLFHRFLTRGVQDEGGDSCQ
ncbi:glycoside hydrolase family 57 protein [Thermocrinis minervae]|uniref:Alpha-amylase/alpha-mannosidase, GH57 family n=1 Tax=Thermocrinis minervae TaxID=381751 RepID=A0A1M6SNK0_9AQUI|nr:glycoside hydrolase family 57 protein [Thermocrinis minervae]SHK46273.1 Alpha-amylase/alpha-mannosidase, GH57 family [Thermocrinis minervae]